MKSFSSFEIQRGAATVIALSAALYATIALGAPKPAASAATAAEVAKCKSMCEGRDNVSCPNAPKEAACNATCATFATEAGSCREQFDAWLDNLSQATWSCDGNGYPHYVGSATGVQSGFFQCFTNVVGAPEKPIPTLALCGVSSNDSFCDNALAFDCTTQAVACGGNAECRAIESCLDKCPNSNSQPDILHTCVEKCKSKHPSGLATFEAINKCSGSAGACGGPTGPNKSLWDQAAKPNAVTYNVFKYCALVAP